MAGVKGFCAGQQSSGVTTYAFIFDGGDLDTDWELNVLMPA